MKHIATIFLILSSFLFCNMASGQCNAELNSVEVYYVDYSATNLKYEQSSDDIIKTASKGKGAHYSVVDTISNTALLKEFDSVCMKNKYLRNEICDLKLKYKHGCYVMDKRLVFILNYSHKKIMICLDQFFRSMLVGDISYKLNIKLYEYFRKFTHN